MIIYFIENRDGMQYIGITGNLARRLKQHRGGRVISTRKGCLKWELIWYWEINSYILASKWERYLHRLQNAGFKDLSLLVCKYPVWCAALEDQLIGLKTTPYECRRQSELGL